MKPPIIYKGGLSGRYYMARAYRQCGFNSNSFEVTGKKEDVTEQIKALMQAGLEAQHRKTWALAMQMAEGNYYAPCPPIEETKDK